MRVLLDARPLQGSTGRRGVGTYVRGLLRGLLDAEPSIEIVALTDRRLGPLERPVRDARVERLETSGPGPALLRGRLLGPRWARRARADVVHATFLAPPRPPRGVPLVATVHDLIPLHHPERFTPRQQRAFRWSIALACRAERIAAVSRVTAEALARSFPLAAGRVVVIPPPVDTRPLEEPPFRGLRGVDGPYLLHLGGFDPLKGVEDLLLPAFARVAGSRPALTLVLTGAGPRADSAAARAQELGIGGRTLLAGHLGADDHAAAVAGASAVVVSSHEEGFGLPVVEALAARVPVAIGPAEASREAAGGLAQLAATATPDDLADAIERALAEGGPESPAGAARLARARDFAPARVGATMAACYRDALAGPVARTAQEGGR